MYLNREEERIYDGEYGWAKQVCMKILVKLGELFGASRLIPVESAHVSGVSYKTLGDAPIDFLEALAESCEKVAVEATLNPQSLDPKHLIRRLPENLVKTQLKLCQIFEKMGFRTSYTCTPYYVKKPTKGAHLAWAESSAVVYANSILGAWTNREGGPSALAAAIIGKTPDCGIHNAENREPKVMVEVRATLEREVDYGALGIFLGKVLEDKIPLITGLKNPTLEKLKQLGAALASSGMVNMFHYDSATPKTPTQEPLEKVVVEARNIQEAIEELTTTSTQKPDLIFIGCPHCSLREIREIAEKIGDKKVRRDMELWICTSRHVKDKARKHVQRIEASGAKIITDTCAVVTWTDKLGIKTIMTNSAKTAHYAPTLNKAEAKLASLEECLKTALKE
ncbi:MAG: aconitase X catalytic domain-containing protein [Candidatus Bathyarchaeia archaeon]